MKRVRQKKRSIAGFTLLEVLVVIIIVGVLFAIAAPGWNALMNRQRVNVVRDQASQIIRQAQADARRTKRARIVVFDNSTGVPRVATFAQKGDDQNGQTVDIPIDTTGITNWQTLGNGDIRSGVLDISTTPPSVQGQLVFKSDGALDDVSVRKATVPNVFFGVNIIQKNTSPQTRRCIVVTTLLGATRLAEGDNCPTSPT